MDPKQIKLINYGVFRDETITLPEGLVGILGEIRNGPAALDSNGSGKSTLVNALVACLFGPSGRSFEHDLTRGEDRMEIELTFEQGGETYRVRRTFTVKGGAKLDFERDGGLDEVMEWGPLTLESVAATQSLIDRTIGFSRSTFLDSVFLSQEDGSFADGKASEVKQLLTEAAFGLEPSWPVYAARASTERKAFEVELQQVEGRTQAARAIVETKAELEREHEGAVENETVAADTVADREREHVALAEQWQAAREQAARRQAVEAEWATARAELAQLQTRDVAATEAVMAIGTAREALTGLPAATETDRLEARIAVLEEQCLAHHRAGDAYEAALRDVARFERERETWQLSVTQAGGLAEMINEKIATLAEQHAAKCELCAQDLPDEARAKTVAAYEEQATAQEQEAADARARIAGLVLPVVPPAPEGEPPTAELATVRGQYKAVQDATAERARLEERIAGLQQTVDARPNGADLGRAQENVLEKMTVVDALAPVDLAAIELQGASAKGHLVNAKAALDSARSLVSRLDERRVQMTAAEQALADASTRTGDLHRQLDTRVRLEKACGLNGVPALILETAVIPFMEAQAAAALAALGTPWQIEIRTQRAKKDGDLTDSCEVVVLTETGESPFRKLSGGEQMRVSIALRVALSALMPGRSGIFVIDEPRWLDAAGVEALIESLRGLLGRYSRVYVVTQSGTALRDSFDSTLTVVKDGGRSRVLDGYAVEAEAVAA